MLYIDPNTGRLTIPRKATRAYKERHAVRVCVGFLIFLIIVTICALL